MTSVLSGFASPLDVRHAMLGTPVLSPLLACIVCVSLVIARAAERRMPSALRCLVVRLASVGTVVILGHAVVLQVLEVPATGTLGDFILALALPWGAGLLLQRTSLSPLLVGAPALARAGNSKQSVPSPRILRAMGRTTKCDSTGLRLPRRARRTRQTPISARSQEFFRPSGSHAVPGSAIDCSPREARNLS